MATIVTLDDATEALLQRVAASQGKSKESFAAEALREAVEFEAGLLEMAKKGQEDFAQGRWITHRQLVDRLEARRRKQAGA